MLDPFVCAHVEQQHGRVRNDQAPGAPEEFRPVGFLRQQLSPSCRSRRRTPFHVGAQGWPGRGLLSPLPKQSISRDQVTLMKADNVVATEIGTLLHNPSEYPAQRIGLYASKSFRGLPLDWRSKRARFTVGPVRALRLLAQLVCCP